MSTLPPMVSSSPEKPTEHVILRARPSVAAPESKVRDPDGLSSAYPVQMSTLPLSRLEFVRNTTSPVSVVSVEPDEKKTWPPRPILP